MEYGNVLHFAQVCYGEKWGMGVGIRKLAAHMFLNRIIKLILLKNMFKQSVGAVRLRFSIELSKVHLWKIYCRRPVHLQN